MRRLLLGASGAALVSLLLASCLDTDTADDCHNTLTCADAAGGTAGAGGSSGGDSGGGAGADTGGQGGTASGGASSGGTGATGGTSSACAEECEAPTAVCDEVAEECVECLKDGDCSGDESLCDTTSKTCVECVESEDCSEANAARCDAGTCTACTGNPDCAHVAGKGICDSGTCVGCTSEADCDGKVCDLETRTCTALPAHALNACEGCEHDAQCQVGQVCVEMKYSDPTEGVVGSFCLWRKDATGVGAPNGSCGASFKPFAQSAPVSSVNGVETTVCRLATTTCPALLQHRTTVTGCSVAGDDDTACGAAGFNDGRCRLNSEDEPKCSYPCGGNEDCYSGFTCPATGDRYCSL